jgi:hypothetical protein
MAIWTSPLTKICPHTDPPTPVAICNSQDTGVRSSMYQYRHRTHRRGTEETKSSLLNSDLLAPTMSSPSPCHVISWVTSVRINALPLSFIMHALAVAIIVAQRSTFRIRGSRTRIIVLVKEGGGAK